eukprot:664812-Pelagomonas_calceolata.AAC.1
MSEADLGGPLDICFMSEGSFSHFLIPSITCPANPNRPPTPPSHRVLRSTGRNEGVRSSTTPARQLHGLNKTAIPT